MGDHTMRLAVLPRASSGMWMRRPCSRLFSTTRSSGGDVRPDGKTTIDKEEVAKFSAIANEWWEPDGPFRALHQMTESRLEFVNRSLDKYYGLQHDALADLRVIDVGC